MKSSVLLLLAIIFLHCRNIELRRTKRTLLFPEFTVLQFTYGFSVPLILPSRSINLSCALQRNFNLPFNVSHWELYNDYYAKSMPKSFDINRYTFYKYIINYINNMGLDGEECLYRSICEIAEIPVFIDNKETLMESLVHYILTPSHNLKSGNEIIRTVMHNASYTFEDKLHLAESVGKVQGSCNHAYPLCEVSIVDMFTRKFYVSYA